MAVAIPDEVIQATRMSEAEMEQEFAVFLFERERLTLEQASRFATDRERPQRAIWGDPLGSA